jgi:hypothetical protein
MVAGFIAGGVGVAGIIVGSIYGVRTFSKKDKGNAACDGRYCSQEGLDLHQQAETSAAISTVGFGVGIAGVGAGLALILISRANAKSLSRSTRPAATEAKAGRGRVWVAPGTNPGTGGLSLSAGGTF